MSDTVFAEKLKDTAIGVTSRLYMACDAALRKRNDNVLAAQRDIADAIQNDLNSIRELCGDDLRALIERKAYAYAKDRLRERAGKVDEAGSHSNFAKDGRASSASASFHEPLAIPEAAGPTIGASNGQIITARSPQGVAPFRDRHKPGHAKRGAAVIAMVEPAMEKVLLETYRTLDGRIIGEMTFSEVRKHRAASVKDAALMQKILHHAANVEGDVKVKEAMGNSQFALCIAEAEEISRAA
jgi:hypothetical protein